MFSSLHFFLCHTAQKFVTSCHEKETKGGGIHSNSANVGSLHLGRIPNCSEVPDIDVCRRVPACADVWQGGGSACADVWREVALACADVWFAAH